MELILIRLLYTMIHIVGANGNRKDCVIENSVKATTERRRIDRNDPATSYDYAGGG